MPIPSITHLLVSTAAIGGISLLWLDITIKAAKKAAQLTNEMFADNAAEERKIQREMEQEERKIQREMEQEEEEAGGKTD